MLVFGGGYAAAAVGGLGWLRDKRVYYWGDLDARFRDPRPRPGHRAAHPVVSDGQADAAGPSHAVGHRIVARGPAATASDGGRIGAVPELVEDVHGRGVRLEQERIRLPVNLAEVVADDTA